VLSVTIDRPDSLNSLTIPVITALADTMECVADDPEVKVVRLGGAGRGFCLRSGHQRRRHVRRRRSPAGRNHPGRSTG